MSQTTKPESIEETVSRLESTLEKQKKRVIELEKIPKDAKELIFSSLLSEVQNADVLVENHSRLSLVLSTGLLAFATTESVVSIPTGVLAFLGGVVLLIWVTKIFRHKEIFDHCYERLLGMDENQTAIRPKPKFWMHGFNLMLVLPIVIVLAWVGVLFLSNTPKSGQQDNHGSIQEKLSYVGSQLDAALNEAKLVEDHVDEIDNDTIVASERLKALEIEVIAIKRNLSIPETDED